MISTRREYGLSFDNKNVEARTFQFKDTFIILVKQDAPLSECLENELRQIKF
jgi:hypothetical protein